MQIRIGILATALNIISATAFAQSGSWNGTWVGKWNYQDTPVSIMVRGDKVVQYLFAGRPTAITRSQVLGNEVTFGNGQYVVILNRIDGKTANASYQRGDSSAAATLTKR